MHSSIIGQVFDIIIDWINTPLPWDSGTFTIFSYLCWCALGYVIALFVDRVLLFWVNNGHFESMKWDD